MAFFRSVSAFSRLRSRVGQQPSLANSVRWLQLQTSTNTDLYSEMKELVPEYQERVKKLKKDHANVELGKTTLDMVLGGMRGMTALVWLGSAVDPDEGIRFRGMTIPECQKALPGAFPGGEPLPEAILWLLLTGKIPNKEQVDSLAQELRRRAKIPEYAFKAIDALPVSAHPMTQFSTGVMALQVESEFQKAYEGGIHKSRYWEPTYEDSLNLIARLPGIAAYIYRRIYKDGKIIPLDDSLDYGANYAHMLGFDDPEMLEFMRLYISIHSDHEGGNVNSHTAHLVTNERSVGEDAFVWLGSLVSLAADVTNGRFTFESLTAPTGFQLHFPAYDMFLKEVHKTFAETGNSNWCGTSRKQIYITCRRNSQLSESNSPHWIDKLAW